MRGTSIRATEERYMYADHDAGFIIGIAVRPAEQRGAVARSMRYGAARTSKRAKPKTARTCVLCIPLISALPVLKSQIVSRDARLLNLSRRVAGYTAETVTDITVIALIDRWASGRLRFASALPHARKRSTLSPLDTRPCPVLNIGLLLPCCAVSIAEVTHLVVPPSGAHLAATVRRWHRGESAA